jgi:hypothetical protein
MYCLLHIRPADSAFPTVLCCAVLCCAVLCCGSSSQDLDPLSTLPHLTTLCLLGNPVSLKKEYRSVVAWLTGWWFSWIYVWICFCDGVVSAPHTSTACERIVSVWLPDSLPSLVAGCSDKYTAQPTGRKTLCSRYSMGWVHMICWPPCRVGCTTTGCFRLPGGPDSHRLAPHTAQSGEPDCRGPEAKPHQ